MKGGVYYFSNRYSKAKSNYLKSYDPKQELKHIIYLDTNSFYGYATSKFLPTVGFKWIDPKDFNLNKYNKYSSKVCALEVDLVYPKELCKLHNDFSLVLLKIEIKEEMLSKCQVVIADFHNIPNGNVKKLLPTFFDEEKYVIYLEKLQLYLRLGLKLKNKSCARI